MSGRGLRGGKLSVGKEGGGKGRGRKSKSAHRLRKLNVNM